MSKQHNNKPATGIQQQQKVYRSFQELRLSMLLQTQVQPSVSGSLKSKQVQPYPKPKRKQPFRRSN